MAEAEKRDAEPTSLADELPSPKRIQTGFHPPDSTIINLPEPMDTADASGSDSESTTSVHDNDEPEDEESDADKPSIIAELFYATRIESVANEMLKYTESVPGLEELLLSLVNDANNELDSRALNHFNKVEKIWKNLFLIGVILKQDKLPYEMERFNRIASRKLSAFLMGMIKSDPLFAKIPKYQDLDDATVTRNALSILLGYWSNEENIGLLVFALGSRFLGLQCVLEDAAPSVVKGDYTLVMGEEKGENKMCMESSTSFQGMSVYFPIEEIRQDASIKGLADRLSNIPEVVRSCKRVLGSLQHDVPVGYLNLFYYHDKHRNAVLDFWFNPHIIVQLIKELKQSTLLVNVFKKYIKRAQHLRCVQRMTYIQEDPLLDSILQSDDFDKRLRGALSVLFGYWSDVDLTYMFSTLWVAKTSTQTSDEVDLTKSDVEVFEYMTDRPRDVEGLKNVLADKYSIDSQKYEDLLEKIRKAQKAEEEKLVEPEYGSLITVMLINGEVKYFEMSKFPPKSFYEKND